MMSQQEVAEKLGITRARVGQIEAQAMRKLRIAADRMGIRPEDFIDVLRPKAETR